jgi:hypothetical protein
MLEVIQMLSLLLSSAFVIIVYFIIERIAEGFFRSIGSEIFELVKAVFLKKKKFF